MFANRYVVHVAVGLALLSSSAGAQTPPTPTQSPEISTDPTAAPAGTYTLDKAHTSVTMKVSHLGLSYYTLRFDHVEGALDYDPAHPDAAKLNIAIDANSVDTGSEAFNRQLEADIFDSARYPQITLVSTVVRPGGEGRGTVQGDLSFRGVVKPVRLDVIFNGAGQVGAHATRMGFSASTTIRRSDFGAVKYLPAVGDEVSVIVEAEFIK